MGWLDGNGPGEATSRGTVVMLPGWSANCSFIQCISNVAYCWQVLSIIQHLSDLSSMFMSLQCCRQGAFCTAEQATRFVSSSMFVPWLVLVLS